MFWKFVPDLSARPLKNQRAYFVRKLFVNSKRTICTDSVAICPAARV